MQKSTNQSIRITSGELRGRRLATPNTSATHPMGDRQRLAMFNVLGDMAGLQVLDLCAGSGVIGIEALSRGATHVTFVDNSLLAVQGIKEQCIKFGLLHSCTIVQADIKAFAAQSTQRFDIVFLDPPYDKTDSFDIAKVSSNHGANVVVVSLPGSHIPPKILNYTLVKTLRHASAALHFFKSC